MAAVGCGVGNAVFPLAEENPTLRFVCCDFSPTAIQHMKVREKKISHQGESSKHSIVSISVCDLYIHTYIYVYYLSLISLICLISLISHLNIASQAHDEYVADKMDAFVADITQPSALQPMGPDSCDVALLLFVLSAIEPAKFAAALSNVAHILKPGSGLLLLRDYAVSDALQDKFEQTAYRSEQRKEEEKREILGLSLYSLVLFFSLFPNTWTPQGKLSDNFYVRGDGTCAYYFAKGELHGNIHGYASSV